jgi:feruloyl-CoA synthase
MTLLDLVDSAAFKHLDKAMIEQDGPTWTYREAVEASHSTAARLQARGIGPGDRVAIMSHNVPEFIIAAVALWRLGAVLVPVNHKLTALECRYVFDHSGSALILASGALQATATLAGHAAPVLPLDGVGDDGTRLVVRGEVAAERIERPVDPDQPAQILYTSGTTGKPKGCVHTHRTVRNTAMLSAISFSMVPTDRTLIAMPIWHAAPLNNFCMPTLFVGGTIVLLRDYAPEPFVRSLQDDRISVYFGAPVSFTMPLDLPGGLDQYDFSAARVLAYGGGPIGAALSHRLAEAYRTDRFYQVYGMTETGPGGTLLYPDEQVSKAGSIGRMSQPGTDMRVVRPDGEQARAGEVGEVRLRSDSLMTGYLDDPDATAAAVTDGWYRTGDLARVDDDGYLFIVDRLKDMIVTGGENVYSKEVEDALQGVEGIAECAVIGVPHDAWGETVVAVVVPRPGGTLNHDRIRLALRDRLAPYKIPRRILEIDSLPRNPTGKVLKVNLRAMAATGSARPSPGDR